MVAGLFTAAVLLASVRAGPCSAGGKVPCVELAGGESMPMVAMGSWGGADCSPGNFTCMHAWTTASFSSWLDMGGRFIDTANDYKDQVAIGQFLKGHGLQREELFITTKCPGASGYDAIIQCVDDNMQMLDLLGDTNTEVNGYIDLLLIHFPFKTPLNCRFREISTCTALMTGSIIPPSKEDIQSSWTALEDLKKLGALKSIGVSNYNITHLQWIREIATEPIDVNQVSWNPLKHDEELLEFCKAHGITQQAYQPLRGDVEFDTRYVGDNLFINPVLEKIAGDHGVSTAEVMLRWSIQQGVAIVTSSGNPAHQKSDMALWGFSLGSHEMASISGLAASFAAPTPTDALQPNLTTLYS